MAKVDRTTAGAPPAKLGRRTAALKGHLDALPGAAPRPLSAARGSSPIALLYKVMGKMFAILSVRGDEYIIVKCDPGLAEILRARYSGIGHRSHLDRRYWISVALDADVPAKEV
jgi:predicted DNA-binding protein (MmcQ/YjbR family)